MLFRLLKLVNLDNMKLLYHHFISYVHYLFLPLLLLLQSSHLSTITLDDLRELRNHPWINPSSIIICFTLLALMAAVYVMNRPHPIYILDFSCFKPVDANKVTRAQTMRQFEIYGITGESFDFQRRVLESSGLGEATYLPLSHLGSPGGICIAKAREEAEATIFGVVDELFEKSGVEAKDVGVLVVNCSIFNPTPSYTAMIVNRYKLRGNVISYNLGGMGCSAGIIAVDLARNLLQVGVSPHSSYPLSFLFPLHFRFLTLYLDLEEGIRSCPLLRMPQLQNIYLVIDVLVEMGQLSCFDSRERLWTCMHARNSEITMLGMEG